MTFAILWITVKAGWPYRLVPNKDRRFVVLALLEYLGVGTFLGVVGLVGRELKDVGLELKVGRWKRENGELLEKLPV